MKTRMLFVIQNLERNEASIALLERLYRLSPEKYEVELKVLAGQSGMNRKAGGLYKKIPEYVKILNDNINNKDRHKTDIKISNKTNNETRIITKNNYDIAASFSDGEAAKNVAEQVHAHRKYLFLFGETEKILKYEYKNNKLPFSNVIGKKRGGNLPKIQLYDCFDQIYTANFIVKSAFLRKYPTLAGRTFILPETIHWDRVERLAGLHGGFADKDFDGIRILSVDSIGFRGHFDLALAAAKRLKERGFCFRWYLIGDGFGKWRYELLIRGMGVADHVILLGGKANPYPYIRQCDLYAAIGNAMRSSLCNVPSGSEWNTGSDFIGIEGALLLEKYVIATDDVQMHCRLLEWEEDAVLVAAEPNVFADAVESIAGTIFQEKYPDPRHFPDPRTG